MPRPHHGPPDASLAPRYTGVRTFARCPNVTDWASADVAVIGVPFDTATSYRTGARFGPAAIRDQSQLLRPWHGPRIPASSDRWGSMRPSSSARLNGVPWK